MTDPADTRRALLAEAAARLAAAGVPQAAADARRLAAWAAGLDAAAFAARLRDPPAEGERARLAEAVERRAASIPLSHITGERLFWGRSFRVTADVLDPRPETETLVSTALEQPAERILDLGTGSGCILLTLLAEWPRATGLGTDLDEAALAVARENAARLGLAERALLLRADWLEGIAGPFDLVVSNPPYIAEAEIDCLAPEVRAHEPRMALTPGPDSLAAYARIAAGAPAVMAPGARLLLEVGPGQANPVGALLAAEGLALSPPRSDMDERERVVIATNVA